MLENAAFRRLSLKSERSPKLPSLTLLSLIGSGIIGPSSLKLRETTRKDDHDKVPFVLTSMVLECIPRSGNTFISERTENGGKLSGINNTM